MGKRWAEVRWTWFCWEVSVVHCVRVGWCGLRAVARLHDWGPASWAVCDRLGLAFRMCNGVVIETEV